ncbi:MAG TPA: YXWGXW repeat-containing protein [Dongiaceae bacterium]|nr:YXWGXW repeat-containing protein [Dongiaceae bacterium]
MNRSILRYGILAAIILVFSVNSFAGVFISVRFGPPALPVYAQPICPGPGYVWTPGYWAWNDDAGYYWVPGTWVLAPVGMYWTPGYWGWSGGYYLWHGGYWGPHVGFYGGINYGFGYTGVGFHGGEWRGRSFYYNRSVTNVSVTNVTNVYNRTVIVNRNSTVSYNGGNGGISARPTPQEQAWAREPHTSPLDVQSQHERTAAQNRENFASANHGRPAIAATVHPADFGRRSVVPARAAGGEYHPPAMSPREARVNSPAERGANSNVRTPVRSNEGFRPFTPPAKNNAASAPNDQSYKPHQGGSSNPGHDSRNNQSRPPEQHNVYRPAPQHNAPRPEPQHSSPPPHATPAPHYNPPPQHHEEGRPNHPGKGF